MIYLPGSGNTGNSLGGQRILVLIERKGHYGLIVPYAWRILMSLFTIDSEKCLCCGLCAAECPAGCILYEPDQSPVPHEKKYAYCIECGHCMAVCPSGAFQLTRFDVAGLPADRSLKLSGPQVEQFLKMRRSVRAFRNEPVGRDVLERLLDLTQYAPSGHNARAVRWGVAATPEKVQGIAEATVGWMRGEVEADSEMAAKLHLAGIVRAWDGGTDLVCRHAPALAVAHGVSRGVTPIEDGVIGVTYLELAVAGAGLGACWCGYVHMAANLDDEVRRLLGIPEGNKAFGALMLGKAVRRFSSIPPRPKADVNWL